MRGYACRVGAGLIVAMVAMTGCGSPADDALPATTVETSSVHKAETQSDATDQAPGSRTTSPVADDSVYGDPAEASEYWVEQSFEDCGLMAVATVIGLMTGDAPVEDDIIAVAASTPDPDGSGDPIYIPLDPNNPDSDNGTDSDEQLALLQHYGITATATDDDGPIPTGLPALQQYLNDGRKTIVGVNAETIWGEDGDHTEDDHSVVVAAVDTDQGIVYLSDSGTDGGAGEQVDIETFETAWETGGHDLIVTDQAA